VGFDRGWGVGLDWRLEGAGVSNLCTKLRSCDKPIGRRRTQNPEPPAAKLFPYYQLNSQLDNEILILSYVKFCLPVSSKLGLEKKFCDSTRLNTRA
jgi:hypothetical protein